MDEDTQAALEWQEHEDSLCSGCGQPRNESFAPEMEERYDVEVLVCHSCARRERKAWDRQQAREADSPPSFGEFFIVRPEDE